MDPRTFVEMTENMGHTIGKSETILLVGPGCIAALTYLHRHGDYVLNIHAGEDLDRLLFCNFVRAEVVDPDKVRLISRYGDRIDMTVFDPTRFELSEWDSSRGTGRSSMNVEQSEEAMAHGLCPEVWPCECV